MSFSEMKQIDWRKVKPLNNPTIARMLLIAIGIFTTIDVGEAIISQKYWVYINYVGVRRFAGAIGEDISWCLGQKHQENKKRCMRIFIGFHIRKLTIKFMKE